MLGGCEKVVQKIVESLTSDYEVFVFTRRVSTRSLDDFKNYKVIEYTPSDIRGFTDKLKAIDPSILFVYSDRFDFFRHLVASRSARYKLIVALCGANWLYENGPTFKRRLGRLGIDMFICHSECDRDFSLCQTPGISQKTFVIPNGVDLEEFDENTQNRNALIQKYYLDNIQDKRWIVNISNFFPGKGQIHLVDIIRELDPEEYFYFQISSTIDFSIGDELEYQWKKKIVQHSKNYRLLKNINRNDVISFLKNSNVFAFTTEKEVAPLVVLESMAARLPWVSTTVGNVSSLRGGRVIPALKDGHWHNIFDKRVKDLFVKHIKELSCTPSLGDEGRQQVEDELTWDRILPHYSNVIENA